MSERFVLITGCGGGLGQAFCRSFSQNGYTVIGTDRIELDESKMQPDHFMQVELAALVHDEAQMTAFRDSVHRLTGGTPLSVLINNAAVQKLGRTDEISISTFCETFDVNVAAPFALTRAFLSDLEETRGAVINLGSVHTRATKPRFAAYTTSKAAIEGLTRALAVDLGPRVRVVAIAPAAIDTSMLREGFVGNPEGFAALGSAHPVGRIGHPEEIADLAVFLASGQAGFLTGTTVYADGGVLSRLYDPA
ncbi:SDR family NAD(P)-dependent oxidoreductase [Parvularcula maris]|uniref:SDR family oxidoreductase n=1 Tax=Parvularcula maris TaxID=2965077 RepID=A0A9X2RK08_9PROT|nr:SDR family oxidoreductase [Parvularcula maris]MCQ8185147.1 SDR family oxidoreductase [Parvularcula maris]